MCYTDNKQGGTLKDNSVHTGWKWAWRTTAVLFLTVCFLVLFSPLLVELLKTGPYL
jgi:hypothetical protein